MKNREQFFPSSYKRIQMSRYLSGTGLEIGALCQPLPLPTTVEQIYYTDHLDNPALRTHYPEFDHVRFVELACVSDYGALPFVDNALDFIITNHTIEHAENVFRVIHEFQRVLKPNGILYMAVPDKRATFDLYREPVSFEHLADEYRNGASQNRQQHYGEWVRDGNKYFHPNTTLDEANVDYQIKDLMTQNYSIHFHAWTAKDFLAHILLMRAELGIDLDVLDFATLQQEVDNEFIMILQKPNRTEETHFRAVSRLVHKLVEQIEVAQTVSSQYEALTPKERWMLKTYRKIRGVKNRYFKT